jgi:hypothetical protein
MKDKLGERDRPDESHPRNDGGVPIITISSCGDDTSSGHGLAYSPE